MKKGVIAALAAAACAAAGAGAAWKKAFIKAEKNKAMSDKHLALFLMMNQWVKVKQEGKSIALFLQEKGFHNIAVYGMSYAGETLLSELKDTPVTVVYGIDAKAGNVYVDVDVVSIDDELKNVDAVVVTAITYFDEIEEKLSQKTDCPILSLEDILYEV